MKKNGSEDAKTGKNRINPRSVIAWAAAAGVVAAMIFSVRSFDGSVETFDAASAEKLSEEMTEFVVEKALEELEAQKKAKLVRKGTLSVIEEVELSEEKEEISIEKTSVEELQDDGASDVTYALRDGTYTGTGRGYRDGALTVQVVIKNELIKSVKVLSAQYDGESFLGMCGGLLSSIVEAQGTDVDTVSGATYSSRGIIEGVNDCLNQALYVVETGESASDENADTTIDITDQTDSGSEDDPEPASDALMPADDGTADGINDAEAPGYADGQGEVSDPCQPEAADDSGNTTQPGDEALTDSAQTETGTGWLLTEYVSGYVKSWGYDVFLNVTIWTDVDDEGNITAEIKNIEYVEISPYDMDNEEFMLDALYGYGTTRGVIKQILDNPTLEIYEMDTDSEDSLDSVSGATYSSKGIVKAINEAITQAKAETEGLL